MNHQLEHKQARCYREIPHHHNDIMIELNLEILDHINLNAQLSQNQVLAHRLAHLINNNQALRHWVIIHIDTHSPSVVTILCMLYNILTYSPAAIHQPLLTYICNAPHMITRTIECLHLADELITDKHDQMVIRILQGAMIHVKDRMTPAQQDKHKAAITRLMHKEKGCLSDHSIEQLEPIAQAFN